MHQKLENCTIEYNHIEKYITKLRNEYYDVQSIDFKIDTYMTDYLRSIYWVDKSNEENIQKYFTNKIIVEEIIKEIKFKYECGWNEIEQQSEHIQNILCKNFEEIEEDQQYISSEMLLEKINNDASKYINPIRAKTVEKIKLQYQNYVILNPNADLNEFDKIHKELKKEFEQEIEKVYKKVLVENKIDKNIQQHILELFIL
jgi:hypothetical protein